MMPLGMEVGFVPGDIVLDGDPAPPPKKGRTAAAPTIRPMSIVTSWMDQYAIWYGGRVRTRAHCVRWDSAPPKRGHSHSQFSAMSVGTKRLDG